MLTQYRHLAVDDYAGPVEDGLPEWASKRQESQFIEIAGSFSDYVDKLYVDEEELRDELEETLNDDSDEAWKEWLEIAFPDWRTRFADLIA